MKRPGFSLLYAGLIMLMALACRPDPQLPEWEVNALTPLIHTRLEIQDMVADSNLSVSGDGLLSLYYRQKIAELQPDEIMRPLSEEFFNVIDLESIDLGVRSFTDHITLGELAQGGSVPGQLILSNNGKRAVVPVFPNQGPKKFAVDATTLFQTITLQSGKLTVSFENELPVALNDIQFRLENKNSGTVVIQSHIDTLKSRSTYSEEFSLSNQTIDGELTAVLQRFSSPGSNGDTVQIDTSERIVINVKLEDLIVKSATAVFPDQVLAQDTTDTDEIKTGNALLTRIVVDSGKIFLDATSTIEDVISMNYIVPNATRNGQVLDFKESIPAAPPAAQSSRYSETDISGYEIDLTGRPGQNVYNRFYTILLGRVDSSGRLINLSLDDSVSLRTGIKDLTASQGYGYMGKDSISYADTTSIDFFSSFNGGTFDLADARFTLEVDNYIGAPIDLYLNKLEALNPSQYNSLNWSGLGKAQTAPAASLANGIPSAANYQLDINSSNSNIDELVEIMPEYFRSGMLAVINGSTPAPDFNQFIFADYGINAFLTLEIPLHLSADGLRLRDTVDFNFDDFDPDEQVQQAVLKLIGRNHYPMAAKADLYLLDEQGEVLDTLQAAESLQAAKLSSDGFAAEETKSVVDYPLSTSQVVVLRQTHRIAFDISLTSAGNDKVKIRNTDYLDLSLAGDLTVRTR